MEKLQQISTLTTNDGSLSVKGEMFQQQRFKERNDTHCLHGCVQPPGLDHGFPSRREEKQTADNVGHVKGVLPDSISDGRTSIFHPGI